jgi:hypothetical protein
MVNWDGMVMWSRVRLSGDLAAIHGDSRSRSGKRMAGQEWVIRSTIGTSITVKARNTIRAVRKGAS